MTGFRLANWWPVGTGAGHLFELGKGAGFEGLQRTVREVQRMLAPE